MSQFCDALGFSFALGNADAPGLLEFGFMGGLPRIVEHERISDHDWPGFHCAKSLVIGEPEQRRTMYSMFNYIDRDDRIEWPLHVSRATRIEFEGA